MKGNRGPLPLILLLLSGMVPPTAGRVLICGYNVAENTREARKNISFCQQHDVFFADLTVREHLIFFGTVSRSSSQP